MSILFLLIPLGLLLVGIAVWAFFWAVSSGQFDDLSSPAFSVLMDDDENPESLAAGSSTDRPAGVRKDRDVGSDRNARA
jgi:cbb3-type cytochrome oxidase maturation protein